MHTMHFAFLFLLLATATIIDASEKWIVDRMPQHRPTWVLLIAGSAGYYNYRHQADICHAYQLLRQHGIPADHIVTMMYDDIAYNPLNPYPGKIFNRPNGSDVYAGVKIDYRAEQVTAHNVLAVLSGNANAVANSGNGRVLESNEDDNIFVYFADHGAPGLLAVIDDSLYATQIQQTLQEMHEKKRFNHLVFYVEACESGSIFLNMSSNINVYAVTAADAAHSSWGTYCDNTMPMMEDICLGDEFSVVWMENADQENLQLTQLKLQYDIVKSEVKHSKVCRFGDYSILHQVAAEFMGWQHAAKQPRLEQNAKVSWPSRDIPLMMAKRSYEKATDHGHKQILKQKVDEIEMKREYLHKFMAELVGHFVPEEMSKLQAIVDRRSHTIEQIECYQTAVNAFNLNCFPLGKNPYALSQVYILANLCDLGYKTDAILAHFNRMCEAIKISDIH